MSKGLDFNKIKDGIIDKVTDQISQIIKDATDGTVSVESIIRGQVKVDINTYIDKAMLQLNNTLESNNLNSSELPDVCIDFEHAIACGIVIPGTVDIQDGSMNGLANFCRSGLSELKIDALNSPMISAKARIGIKNANVEYSGKITLICFGPQIHIIGTVTDISLDIELQVEKNLVVNVHKFEVSSEGDLKIESQDLGSFEYLSDKISEDLKVSVKKAVLEYLKKSVKERLEAIISSLPLTTTNKSPTKIIVNTQQMT